MIYYFKKNKVCSCVNSLSNNLIRFWLNFQPFWESGCLSASQLRLRLRGFNEACPWWDLWVVGEGGGVGGACEKNGGPQKIKGKGGHVSGFTNVFSQSVLLRLHEGGNISRKSETKVGGDSCSIGEIIPFQELGDV